MLSHRSNPSACLKCDGANFKKLMVDYYVIFAEKYKLSRKTAWKEAFEENMAERTGLEPATPGVTGRYSNQLNYRSR